MTVRIAALFAGPARPLPRPGHDPVMSGIAKDRQDRGVFLSATGLQGDEQGDPVYHGGPEKALHQYAAEHYALWRERWPDSLVALAPGAFGENVSTTGMTEASVCIGDVYRLGGATVQVSQGRQPCWRLNRRVGRADAALGMQRSGATGWYYRVLEAGIVAAGDRFELLDRHCPDWPLARLIGALFPAGPVTPALIGEWALAARLGPLTANWKETFARRVATGSVEDWSRRLVEP